MLCALVWASHHVQERELLEVIHKFVLVLDFSRRLAGLDNICFTLLSGAVGKIRLAVFDRLNFNVRLVVKITCRSCRPLSDFFNEQKSLAFFCAKNLPSREKLWVSLSRLMEDCRRYAVSVVDGKLIKSLSENYSRVAAQSSSSGLISPTSVAITCAANNYLLNLNLF